MISLFRGGFSLRGSKVPPWYIVVAISLAAFAVGVGVGWLTGVIPGFVRGFESVPEPTSSVTGDVPITVGPTVSADLYPQIFRQLDADDERAGLTSLDIPLVGTGIMVPAPGEDTPAAVGDTRWVRIEVEGGLPIHDAAVSDHVIDILNDKRGWAAASSQTFARTQGVPELRILVASPQTAAALCTRPHEAFVVDTAPVDTIDLPDLIGTQAPDLIAEKPAPKKKNDDPEPEPSPDAAAAPVEDPDAEPSCASRGIVVVNVYYWAAGVAGFADDRLSARAWLVNHFVGHFRAQADAECVARGKAPVASVMVDHSFAVEPCSPQAWPFPDGAAEPAEPDA